MSPPRRRSYLTRWDPILVVVAAVISAALAATSPAAPTGSAALDATYLAAMGAAIPLLASRGRRWSWLWAAAVLVPFARGWALGLVGVAVVVAFAATTRHHRERLLGGIVGLCLVNAALRLEGPEVLGASLAVGAVAMALLAGSGVRRLSFERKRWIRRGVAAAAAAGVLALAFLALVGLQARRSLQRGSEAAQAALQAARRGDPETARTQLAAAAGAFRDARGALGTPWARFSQLLPGGAQQLHAVDVTVAEALRVADQADAVAAAADYDRLRYDGRIDLAQVRALAEPTRRTARSLGSARAAIDDLDSPWLVAPLTDRLHRLRDDLQGALVDARSAEQVLEVAPALLGGSGERHYFLAFTTPAELRGGGGFIGSYGELTARDGKLSLTRSGGIRDLIAAAPEGARSLDGPADYLRRYGRFRPADFFQDVTYSPDFPQDGSVIRQLYAQSGGPKVDGVLAIDPYGLAALLKLTGPVTVEGIDQPLTSDNAPSLLLREQYVRFGDDPTRRDLLEDAARATFDRLTTGSLPAPKALATALSPAVRQRHIQVWSPTRAEERYFRTVGADGALPRPDGGDALVVTQQNSGNNKIDAFLHRDLRYRSTVDPETGSVRSTLDITVRNDAPSSGLPDAVIGNSRGAPEGSNVAILDVYSALRLVNAELDGFPVQLGQDREGALRVYETSPVVIGPGQAIHLRVRLRGGIDLSDGYRLHLVPQPSVNGDRVSVAVTTRRGWHFRTGGGDVDRLVRSGALRSSQTVRAELRR